MASGEMTYEPKTPYKPKDTITESVKATSITGFAGVAVSAIQNVLTKSSPGAWGFLTRTGGTVATFAGMGFAFQFSHCASANLREKDDSWNHVIGGFFAGAVLGLQTRRLPAVLGNGAAAGIVLGAFDYTGGVLSGYTKDPTVDEYERKENLRKNRRRPIQETVSELGEGRGIYGPGYAERRRERLQARYGVDVAAQTPSES
ncbi:MAG: hypothetical protein M4579_003384 [Chaenotheca gracillima]|nr:MAG: hypothetical protein M4579_003384 [Chaenotheca gracillima]